MGTFVHDGEEFDLVTDIDEMNVGDAETIETALGLDMREVSSAPLSKQLQVFLLISLQRKRPGATLADARKVKLGPILAAFAASTADAPEPAAGQDAEPAEPDVVLSPTSAGSEQPPA